MKDSIIKNIIQSFIKSLQQFGKNRKKIRITAILVLLIQGVSLFETYLLAGITDALYTGKQDDFFQYIGLAVGIGLSAIILQKISNEIDLRVKQETVVHLKESVMDILWTRKENVMQYSSGEQHSIIQEDSEKVVLYVYQVISYLFSMVVIVYISVTLFSISAKWAAVFTVIQIMIGILQKYSVKKIKEKSKECLKTENEFEKYLNEDLSRVHAIRFENLREDVIDFLRKKLGILLEKQIDRNQYSIRVSVVGRSLMYMGKMLLFFGMGTEVFNQRVSMAQFIIFYSYMSTFTSNFMYVIQMITSLQPMLLNVNRILEILAIGQECKRVEPLEYHQIEWKQVEKSFGEKLLFSDVNLRMDLKKSYAVIGANGSGKSTFMKLLFGEEKVSKGQILVDGIDFTNNMTEQFEEVYYFAANPCVLSELTVRENILLGNKRKEILEVDLKEIAKDFLLCKDIEEMDHKWETMVGKEVNLSSGQMKKMQLMRAALCNGKVLILDEPLANLDEEFRKQFHDIFQKYFAGKRIFVVEHDRRRVEYVDEIFIIENQTVASG